MILVTVFLSILNEMELHLVQYQKENRHHDHIPFNLKGNGRIVSPLQTAVRRTVVFFPVWAREITGCIIEELCYFIYYV